MSLHVIQVFLDIYERTELENQSAKYATTAKDLQGCKLQIRKRKKQTTPTTIATTNHVTTNNSQTTNTDDMSFNLCMCVCVCAKNTNDYVLGH